MLNKIKGFFIDVTIFCSWLYTSTDLKAWKFEGRKLARIDQILRRILMLPFLILFKYLYLLAILIADGYSEAEHRLNNWY